MRDKVIGKKWINLERITPQNECGPSLKAKETPGMGSSVFKWVGDFIG